jgi:hypothetical protein
MIVLPATVPSVLSAIRDDSARANFGNGTKSEFFPIKLGIEEGGSPCRTKGRLQRNKGCRYI